MTSPDLDGLGWTLSWGSPLLISSTAWLCLLFHLVPSRRKFLTPDPRVEIPREHQTQSRYLAAVSTHFCGWKSQSVLKAAVKLHHSSTKGGGSKPKEELFLIYIHKLIFFWKNDWKQEAMFGIYINEERWKIFSPSSVEHMCFSPLTIPSKTQSLL